MNTENQTAPDAESGSDNQAGSGVDDRRIVRLLESRHEARLEWHEPWPALGPQDNKIDAHITLSATVHDCVNLQRVKWHDHGSEHILRDKDLLAEFIAVNWATIIEPNEPAQAAPHPNQDR